MQEAFYPEVVQDTSIEISSSFTVKAVEVPGNHGFCGGIRMTDRVHRYLLGAGVPVRANHPPSHNEIHVESLEKEGLQVVGGDPSVVRKGEVYSISAHGAPNILKENAINMGREIVDTTCPFVQFVEREVEADREAGRFTAYGGQRGHQEAIDIQSRNPEAFAILENAEEAQAFVTLRQELGDTRSVVYRQQTTHSTVVLDEIEAILREGIPDIIIPDRRDTCQAVRFRQESIIAQFRDLSDEEKKRRLLLIVGGQKSHNSKAMAEIGQSQGVKSYVINKPDNIKEEWFVGIEHVILSSGASTPEEALEAALDYFRDRNVPIRYLDKLFAEPDDLVFKLPKAQIGEIFERRNIKNPLAASAQ